MTGTHVPLDIGLKRWPPELVEERVVSGIESTMSKRIVCVLDQHESLGQRDDELVLPLCVPPP